MKTQNYKRFAAIIFGIGSCVAVPAMAGSYQETTLVQAPGMEVRTASVSVDDLNLSSAQGQEILHSRLSQAAREVCGPTDHRLTGSIRLAANNRSCQAAAMADALAQVNAGQVASVGK